MNRRALAETPVLLAVLLAFSLAFTAGANAQEAVDDREASFLPPPAALLEVATPKEAEKKVEPVKETATPKTFMNGSADKVEEEEAAKKAVDLTVPPPFTPPAAKVEPAKQEPAKPAPVKVEPAKVEPAKVEPKPVTVAPAPILAPAPAPAPAPTSAAASTPAPAPAAAPVKLEPKAKAEEDLVIPEPVIVSAPEPAPAPAVDAVSSTATASVSPVQAQPVVQPVASAPLAEVDPETVGLLAAHNGGLGASLWKGTTRPTVDRLLPMVGLPTTSPALNDLAKRLFMTTAAAPVPGANGEKPVRNLIAQRIEGLTALGAVAEAWQLASKADAQWVDSVTLRQLTEAALIGASGDEVCSKIPSMMEVHGKTEDAKAEWQKAFLICQLRAKDDKAVQLGLDMMREQQVKDDLFISLMNRNVLEGKKQLPRQLTPLRPTTLAVLRQLDIPLPPELYARPEAALIPELLLTKSVDENARMALAERAAAKGIITPAQLAAAYKSIVLTPEEVGAVNSSAEKGARPRAILYQAMGGEQAAPKKIALIQKYMDGLEPAALCGGQGVLLAGILETIPVTSDANMFAVQAARLMTLAGQTEKAIPWLKLARDAASRSPDLAAPLQKNWPLFVLAGLVPDGEYAAGMNEWLKASLDDNAAANKEDANRLQVLREKAGQTLLVLSAAGYAVPEEAWHRVIETMPPTKQLTPSPVLLDIMKQAAAAGRTGETALLSLLLVDGSASEAILGVKVEVIRALRLVGLTAEAQGLAREVVVGLN